MITRLFLPLVLSLTGFASAFADILVEDAYARSSGPTAKSGAAFMQIANNGDADDRLIGVESPAAMRVELHTHEQSSDGVMKMMEAPDGFVVASGTTIMLERGGDHVMFMGLTGPFNAGESVPVTLVFEQAGEIALDIPVDLDR